LKINELEQHTGLTAKDIRLYEDEQLIKVDCSDNSCREYNEEAVEQLLEIKLYLKFGVKISDLKRWKNGEVNIKDLLSECLSDYEKEDESTGNKTELCKKLVSEIKDGCEVDTQSYLDTLEMLESDEYAQLKKAIVEIHKRSVFSQFYYSLIFLGPILSLFLNYYGLKDYKALAINIPFAVLSTVILSVSWTNFLRARDCSVKNILIGIGKLLLCTISLMLLIAVAVCILMFFGYMTELLFVPKDYLCYTIGPGVFVAVVFFLLELVWTYLLIVNFFSHKKGKRTFEKSKTFFKKRWYVIIALNLVAVYLIPTSLLIASSEKIINHSFLNPLGKVYTYSDIDNIRISMDEDELVYAINMTDGKTYNLADMENMGGMADSDNGYSYLVQIDEIAMNAGASKVVSNVDINNTDYDETSIKNIEKIINNK